MTDQNKSADEKKILIRKGKFRCAAKPSYFKLGFLVGLVFTAAMLVLSFINFGEETNALIGTIFVVCLFLELFLGIMWALTGSDKEYEYSAEENEFIITDHRGNQQTIYYSEVRSIDFSTFKESKTRFGYVVKIVTPLKEHTYRCIFSDNKVFTNPEGTPFHYLSVNSGVEIPYEGMPVLTEELIARFEGMQKEQENRIRKKKKPKSAEEFFDTYGKD